LELVAGLKGGPWTKSAAFIEDFRATSLPRLRRRRRVSLGVPGSFEPDAGLVQHRGPAGAHPEDGTVGCRAHTSSQNTTQPRKIDDSEYGKFAWVIDPEGNKVELWQPPTGQ
jgi:hypothetical protein